jgi:hypothetical protein
MEVGLQRGEEETARAGFGRLQLVRGRRATSCRSIDASARERRTGQRESKSDGSLLMRDARLQAESER